jgi:transglutaminase-like putative cysteine protease
MCSQKFLKLTISVSFRIIISIVIFLFSSPSFSQIIPSNESQEYPFFYKNPKVIDVEYKYKINLDSININRKEDLKVWIPVPRDWNTQKVVEISKVEPECDKDYFDPEHGNRILYWDFGKYPEAESYEIKIDFRIENFQIYVNDSEFSKIAKQHDSINYDKDSNEYKLYTRSTQKRVHLTPEITEMAKEALGDETNPYLQSKAIFQYVLQKMRYVPNRKDRGTGTDVLLRNPVVDDSTGEKYYEGECGQYSGLFIALCRASGIPARPVVGFVQGRTDIQEDDLEEYSPDESDLSPDGFAATLYFNSDKGQSAAPHVWAEFYYPEYGWIPVDLNIGRTFEHLNGPRIIMSKGFDILWAPEFEADELKGYGYQWIPAENRRVDILQSGVWKISKLRNVSVKILYNTDPFPSEAFYEYVNSIIINENINEWKREKLRDFYYASIENEGGDIFEIDSEIKKDRQAYLCHLLHIALGDNSFKEFGNSYIKKRVNSGKPVTIDKLQGIIDSIGQSTIQIKEWISDNRLPEFSLTNVNRIKDKNNWIVSGCVKSVGATKFNVPVELEVETSQGVEIKKISVDSDSVYFNFKTKHIPQKLVIDPNYHFPAIRRMPPLLVHLWNAYPDFTIVYGSIKEAEENKNAAMFFHETSGLSTDLIKKDTEVTPEDLSTKRIILIGRPETNLISKKFEQKFPIKFDGCRASFNGKIYDNPDMGVAQIVENDGIKNSMMIMYAGLSGSATPKICNTQKWEEHPLTYPASFIIFNDFNVIESEEWEDDYSEISWVF